MKRLAQGIVLAVVLGAAFLVGYGSLASAWPGVPDRTEYRGYFANIYDDQGDDVLVGGIPGWVSSADTYIGFIQSKLASASARDRVGASFIIQVQRGNVSGWSRNQPPLAWEMADWESRIRYAESRGWINWFGNFTYSGNSFYQGVRGGGPDPNDNAFYYENGVRQSIIFMTGTGQAASAIKRDCANPLTFGYMPGLDIPPNYNISGRATVSSATVKPGQSITFNHYVRNDGPGDTGGTPIWWIAQDMPSEAGVGGPANSGFYAAGQEKNVHNHTVNVPLAAAVGSQICERVGWDPINGSGGRNGRGPTVCSTVIPDFTLTPVVIADKTSGGEGDQVVFTYQVTSSGITATTSVDCKEVGNNRAPGYTPLPQQDVDRNSDPGYTPPTDTCPRTFQPNTPTVVATETITLSSLTPGSRVCRSLVVNPKNEVGGPRASAETCVVIAKTPYVHFMGNDVWAGGDFYANNPACNKSSKITTVGRTLSDGSSAGSVTEYHAFALDRISGFGSASRVLVGQGSVGVISRSLTFANNEVDVTKLGFFGATPHCIDDYISQYSAATNIAAGTYNVGGRGSGAWHVTGALNLRGTMPAGGEQVYYADGDVTIDQPLVYPNMYNTINDIPSLLVITRGNIRVAPNVTQIDGQFVARGNGATTGVFYTCWPRTEPASVSSPCNGNQLTINGAVHAARLDLFRSAGADGPTPAFRKRPAEVFNFNPELYLNSVLNSASQITIETNNTLDLPPRF